MAIGETQFLLFMKGARFIQTLEGISVLGKEYRIEPSEIMNYLASLAGVKILSPFYFSFGKEGSNSNSCVVDGELNSGGVLGKEDSTIISLRFIPSADSEKNAGFLIESLEKKFNLEHVKVKEGRFSNPIPAELRISSSKICINDLCFRLLKHQNIEGQMAELRKGGKGIVLHAEEGILLHIFGSSEKGSLNLNILGKIDAGKKRYFIKLDNFNEQAKNLIADKLEK